MAVEKLTWQRCTGSCSWSWPAGCLVGVSACCSCRACGPQMPDTALCLRRNNSTHLNTITKINHSLLVVNEACIGAKSKQKQHTLFVVCYVIPMLLECYIKPLCLGPTLRLQNVHCTKRTMKSLYSTWLWMKRKKLLWINNPRQRARAMWGWLPVVSTLPAGSDSPRETQAGGGGERER